MTDFAVGDKVRMKGRLEPVPEGAIGTIIDIRDVSAVFWPIEVDFSPYHNRTPVNPSEIEFVEEIGNDLLDKELEDLLDNHFGDEDEYPDFSESEKYLEALADGSRFYNVFNTFFQGRLDEDPDDDPDSDVRGYDYADWDVRGYNYEDRNTADWDMVANPPHYQQYPFGEVIDITKHLGFLEGNVIKYVLRAPFKGSEIEDLKKAAQYLAWLIEKREEEA